ncbi:MAG TPA: ATP-binding cassette domain-containing protein, partial [Stellaceae bacterium]|nr:ATP-binding cassette domain-containing protein [Stellaceae bacterium]
MTLLEVRDLGVTFSGWRGAPPVAAVKRVSFSLDRGERLALVGESGSGKSVTALSILQLLPYPNAAHPKGSSVRFAGEELVGAPEGRLREVRGNRIAMVFQEPMTSLNPLHTIAKQVAETLLIHKHLSPAAARGRVVELLHLVGLRDAEARLEAYPHQLSGGQRQRVMIAMAIANEPDILIADEPTTALDVTIQAQILHLMRDLTDRLGMALLLITHDLSIVRHMAARTCVMTEGEIVEVGPTERIFARPQHPYTRRLLAAEPKGRVAPADPAAPVILAGDNVKVWFPLRSGLFRRIKGYVKAVDGISLQVREGATLGVVGESGSGKTTLGLALLRLTDSTGGISFAGHDIGRARQRRLRPLRRQMQIVFQDPYSSLSPRLSVAQIVGEGLKVHRLAASEAAERRMIEEALIEVGLDPAAADRYPHEFSGGQRQRIAIARALVLKPRF